MADRGVKLSTGVVAEHLEIHEQTVRRHARAAIQGDRSMFEPAEVLRTCTGRYLIAKSALPRLRPERGMSAVL